MILRPDVKVARGCRHHHAFQHGDDLAGLGPGAEKIVGLLDRVLEQIERRVGALGRIIGILVPALVVALDKLPVERPLVSRRIGEVIVGVRARQNPLGMVLAQCAGLDPECDIGDHLHVVVHAEAQRLLVERNVVATPKRGDQQIGLGRHRFGDVRGIFADEQLGPPFRDDLAAGIELLGGDFGMDELHAAEIVVGMDVRDPFDAGPGPRRREHA